MTEKKELLRFKLCEDTAKKLEDLHEETHISKSELIRLCINTALPYIDQIDTHHRKSVGAIISTSIYLPAEMATKIKEYSSSTQPKSPPGTITRKLIEYGLAKGDFLPAALR